jgi:ubiquinone/menaquinone biosynthesis C-methylase UbiE
MIKYDRPAALTAFQAISEAQKLAFSPIAFQTSVSLIRMGILKAVAEAGEQGAAPEELSKRLGYGQYGTRVLLDMGLSIGLVWLREGRYVLDKIGHFLLNDEMTRTNIDFVADVCYGPMARLAESVADGAPRGLEHLGRWPTLYQGLAHLPEAARRSWLAFDHFYSASAFRAALEIVFASKPRHILDIGGNTGAWAAACLQHDSSVRVTIVDLPAQVEAARERFRGSEFEPRVDLHATDLLDAHPRLPGGADTIWMSQFLDCFPEPQIVRILELVAGILPPNGSLFVLETLCDRQRHEAAAYSINATSLYFTCVANGSSRMYWSEDLLRLFPLAGLRVHAQHDNLGLGHTLLQCVRAD